MGNVKERVKPFLLGIVLMLFLSQCVACGTTGSNQGNPTAVSPYKSLTVQNCGSSLTFTKAPTRVISTGQNMTDILLKLGLEKTIVGIYYGQSYQSDPEFAAAYKRLHSLGQDMMMSPPSRESVLSLHPDFIFSAYPNGDFVATKGMASRDDFKSIGAQVYGLSSECSLNTTQAHVSDVYNDIITIGRIFHVEDRAQEIVHDMQTRIAAVQQKVANHPQVPVAILLLFMGSGPEGTYRVVGAGMFNEVTSMAGGKNVFGDQAQTYVSVGKEAFAVQKPETYVLIHYKGVDADQFANKLYATFPDIPASQQKRSLVIEGNYWNAGIHLADVIEKMARVLHPEVF